MNVRTVRKTSTIINKIIIIKVDGPWRSGIVVIASASIIEDPGFESRQSGRFLGFYT
jgi:hypothetical protein